MTDFSEVRTRWQHGRRFLPVVAAACAGVAVAILAWLAVAAWEERLSKANFTNVAGDYASVLQNGLHQYLDKLVDVRAFYDASMEVDPSEFHLFTGRILEGLDSKIRVTWSPRVTRDERAEFDAKARETEVQAIPDGGRL